VSAEPIEMDELAERLRRKQAGQSIGDRTAADLTYGPPPDQLVDPFLTPDGATILYGKGGTGKGLIACLLTSRLVRAGQVVMILDYEGHEREWGSRLRGLGLTADELAAVHYRAPFGPDWLAERGELDQVAELVRTDAQRVGATYLIVDSYVVATSTGDTMGGAPAAQEYFAGLTRVGIPSLTLAHTKGDSARFPERPFGSVYVHNLARETWAVERTNDPDQDDDYAPRVVALELRNRKANGRAIAAAQFATFSFFADGSIEVDTTAPAGRSLGDMAADAMADGPKTQKQIAAAIREDTGQNVNEDTIGRTLRRYPRRFRVVGETRPKTWGLTS
jgi:AAA domain